MATCDGDGYYNDVVKERECPEEKGEKSKNRPQIRGKTPITFHSAEDLPPPLPPHPVASTSRFLTPL